MPQHVFCDWHQPSELLHNDNQLAAVVPCSCCPAGYTCVNGVCKENTPPPCDTTQGLYQCWLNSTSWICCKQGLNCIPPPLGAVYADPYTACCDPTQTCLDFPSMTSKVCCGKPQTCLNMLYPSPGSVSADQTCCPEVSAVFVSLWDCSFYVCKTEHMQPSCQLRGESGAASAASECN